MFYLLDSKNNQKYKHVYYDFAKGERDVNVFSRCRARKTEKNCLSIHTYRYNYLLDQYEFKD